MTKTSRSTALALVACLSTVSLAACGGDKTSSSSSTATATSTVAASSAAPSSSSTTSSSTTSSSTVESAGAQASSAASASAAAPASLAGYKTITGTGYTVQVSSSWQKNTSAAAAKADIAYVNPKVVNGFRENMNVLTVSGSGTESVEGIFPQVKQQMTSAGLKDIKDEGYATVAGEKALLVSSVATQQGISARVIQAFVPHGGKALVVSYSGGTSSTVSTLKPSMQKILSTIAWT